MDMYIKFTIISLAFLIANTMAFILSLPLIANDQSLFSLSGILALLGVILPNCAAVQLLLAGKYSVNQLFYSGILPIFGFLISYVLLTRTGQNNLAFILYSISLVSGLLLLVITVKRTQNKKGLVL